MARTVAIGIQDFQKIKERQCFYIDKTRFIKEWWESGDDITLITRPRRFGKTLTMSMVEYFFSVKYANGGELFEDYQIWEYEKYRRLQGTYPVISLSFAIVKDRDFETAVYRICQILQELYIQNYYLLDGDILTEEEKANFKKMAGAMEKKDAPMAIHQLSAYLNRYYGKKVIILLDEYDTPMQEAYMGGYWEEIVEFMRVLFHSTLKTNPSLERAILTGITRISKESMFSDLNNLKVVTTTSDNYVDIFGFTEQEVFNAMDEMSFFNKEEVKFWYDGFNFGKMKDIYNPWSIINFLASGELREYWVNTSGNGLVSKLVLQGSNNLKEDFGLLLQGESIESQIDEEVVFDQLEGSDEAVWSLLLASGYLKVLSVNGYADEYIYELVPTNYEVKRMFSRMVRGWFKREKTNYNGFITALLRDDLESMNEYMNRMALSVFSYFDTGKNLSNSDPERFYHGFVLGLLVDVSNRYSITSNRESGFGRYDVMMKPLSQEDDGIILEFKVYNRKKEQNLEDTVKEALKQIEDRKYEQQFISQGIPSENIRKYGFAFEGKRVLIGKG